jgi:hypothetical protein
MDRSKRQTKAMKRPLSKEDIRTIAQYLAFTERDLFESVSELGFDPALYGEQALRRWLRDETSITQGINGFWS